MAWKCAAAHFHAIEAAREQRPGGLGCGAPKASKHKVLSYDWLGIIFVTGDRMSLLPVPRRALAVMAHPDDIEFMAGGLVAQWAAAGVELHYCLLTDGASGSRDPNLTRAATVSGWSRAAGIASASSRSRPGSTGRSGRSNRDHW